MRWDRLTHFAYGALFSVDGVLLRQFLSEAPQLVYRNEALSKAFGIFRKEKRNDSPNKAGDHSPGDALDGVRIFYDVAQRADDPMRDPRYRLGLPYHIFPVWRQDDPHEGPNIGNSQK